MLNKTHVIKKIMGAQGRKTLCLSSIVACVIMVAPALANAQVYNSNPSSVSANAEIRMQQMEDQMRDLTGRVEEQNYEIDQLKKQLIDLQNAQIKTQNNIADVQSGASQIAVPTREPSVTVNSPIIAGVTPPPINGMQTVTPSSPSEFMDDPVAQYDQAFASIKAKDFDEAEIEFKDFLKNHPDHELAANAWYWQGETYYVRGQYKNAAKTFAEGFQKFPENAKSPDILLKLGMSLSGMDKDDNACVALAQLPIKFPTAAPDTLSRGNAEMERLGCKS